MGLVNVQLNKCNRDGDVLPPVNRGSQLDYLGNLIKSDKGCTLLPSVKKMLAYDLRSRDDLSQFRNIFCLEFQSACKDGKVDKRCKETIKQLFLTLQYLKQNHLKVFDYLNRSITHKLLFGSLAAGQQPDFKTGKLYLYLKQILADFDQQENSFNFNLLPRSSDAEQWSLNDKNHALERLMVVNQRSIKNGIFQDCNKWFMWHLRSYRQAYALVGRLYDSLDNIHTLDQGKHYMLQCEEFLVIHQQFTTILDSMRGNIDRRLCDKLTRLNIKFTHCGVFKQAKSLVALRQLMDMNPHLRKAIKYNKWDNISQDILIAILDESSGHFNNTFSNLTLKDCFGINSRKKVKLKTFFAKIHKVSSERANLLLHCRRQIELLNRCFFQPKYDELQRFLNLNTCLKVDLFEDDYVMAQLEQLRFKNDTEIVKQTTQQHNHVLNSGLAPQLKKTGTIKFVLSKGAELFSFAFRKVLSFFIELSI